MMRAVLLEGRQGLVAASRPCCRANHQRLLRVSQNASTRRLFADQKVTEPPVLPGSKSTTASNPPLPPKLNLSSPTSASTTSSTSSIPIENVPKTPPTPSEVGSTSPAVSKTTTPTGTGTASVAPPSAPPPRKRRRGRRFLLFLTTTLALGYAGGIYSSLVNDNFHDFFTEYVPFGEDAVLYFEEREFKRRFGERSTGTNRMYPQTSGERKVTVAGNSGASAKIAEVKKEAESTDKDKRVAATDERLGKTDRAVSTPAVKTESSPAKTKPVQKAQEKAKQAADKVAGSIPAPKSAPKAEEPKAKDAKGDAPKATSQATPAPPIQKIDSLKIDNAADPIVQEIAKILNDVITVVNVDNAAGKYASTMSKAKDALQKLASDISMYRDTASQAAEKQIRQSQADLENQARDLIRRVEQEQHAQELKWREEYEAERERLSQAYQEKLKTEVEASQKVSDQRLRNELLEQNLTLTDSFSSAVRDRVEKERSARLANLKELSSSVSELDRLTSQWGGVVDANVKTQHLVVAVETVRSTVAAADRPKPFVHELAALKETADGNSVVNAAIASINPIAYQRGISTSAQLIDRFRRVASEVRKAALLPEDSGAASHAASFLLSKVLFRKQGLAAGEDVESILTRTETFLEEGNLNDATREMNGLTGWAKVLSKDWIGDCRRVLEVKQALDVMAAEARLQSLLLQ